MRASYLMVFTLILLAAVVVTGCCVCCLPCDGYRYRYSADRANNTSSMSLYPISAGNVYNTVPAETHTQP